MLSQTDNSDTEHHGVLIVCKLIKPSKIIKSRRFNKLKELRVFVRLDIDTLCDSVNWFLFHKIVMNIFRCRISLEIRYISTKTRATSGISIKKTRTEIFCKMRNLQVIYIYEDDLQLGILKENCLLLKLYRKLRKMFLSPRRESNPQPSNLRWDALTIELPGLRWQKEGHDFKRDTCTAKQQSRYVSISY